MNFIPRFFIARREFNTSSDSKRLFILVSPIACEANKTHLIEILLSPLTDIILLKAFSAFAAVMENSLFQAVENHGGNAIDDLFAIERFAEKHIRGDEDRLRTRKNISFEMFNVL